MTAEELLHIVRAMPPDAQVRVLVNSQTDPTASRMIPVRKVALLVASTVNRSELVNERVVLIDALL